MNTTKKYIDEFINLSNAGFGIILTRTREPYRLNEIMQEFCLKESKKSSSNGDNMRFNTWDCFNGLVSFGERDVLNLEEHQSTFIVESIKKEFSSLGEFLSHVHNSENDTTFSDTINLLYYPHFFLSSHNETPMDPVSIQAMKELALCKLSDSTTRLILITPCDFVLPTELKDDIPILDLDTPSTEEYAEIYYECISLVENSVELEKNQVTKLCKMCSGMTTQEFDDSMSRAIAQSLDGDFDVLLEFILTVKTEIVKRSEILSIVDSIPIDQVGGVELFKEWITERKQCFSEEFYEFGGDKLKGVMLCGCPGTGKSLLCKCIAHTLERPCIKVDLSRVFDKYVGNSEARIESALKMLESIAPCVAYVDEIDKLFSGRDTSDVEKRVLGKFLTWLQENDSEVFMLFTANNVRGLPPELIRKGRIDEIFNIGMPTAQERYDVMRIHLAKRKQDINKIKDIMDVVISSEGYMQAEIENAIKESVIHAFVNKVPVTGKLIAKLIKSSKPLSVSHAKQIDFINNWAKDNARMASKEDSGHVFNSEGVRLDVDENNPLKPVKLRKRRIITKG